MQIRPYRDTDWTVVCEIYDLAKPDEMRGVVDAWESPALEADPKMMALFHDSQLLVAEGADRLVGFGGYRGTFIAWLFVHPSFRRQGVARALVREILARLDGTITLNVATPNIAPQNLYKSMGL